MAKFCSECGSRLVEGGAFCEYCGAPVAAPTPSRTVNAQPAASSAPVSSSAQTKDPKERVVNSASRQGVPAPGFSNRVNDPEIRAAVKKNRKAAGIFGMIIIPLPLVGFVIYASVTGKMEIAQAVRYGGFISAVFLVVNLISLFSSLASTAYEGVVVDKKTRLVHGNRDQEADKRTEYTVYVRTSDGKKKKIVEHDGSGMIIAYNYLNVGDRFRYHPGFTFPYELYDKSKAPYIGCVNCGRHNPVENDRCSRCNVPLLK